MPGFELMAKKRDDLAVPRLSMWLLQGHASTSRVLLSVPGFRKECLGIRCCRWFDRKVHRGSVDDSVRRTISVAGVSNILCGKGDWENTQFDAHTVRACAGLEVPVAEMHSLKHCTLHVLLR
jgi:hypothetical protein